MIDRWLTKVIDFIFPHQKGLDGSEKLFWDNYWNKMIDYYKKHGEIFEIRDKWDFYCNEALHNHYKEIVGNFTNLKCLECGCDGGYESSLMARDGAEVTILDYSQKALEYAKIVSRRIGVLNRIKFVECDIFDFHTTPFLINVIFVESISITFARCRTYRITSALASQDVDK